MTLIGGNLLVTKKKIKTKKRMMRRLWCVEASFTYFELLYTYTFIANINTILKSGL